MRWPLSLQFLACLTLSSASFAQEAPPTQEAIREAAQRGLALVQTAATNYPNHRDCFSCHHQTLPVMAIAKAREAGLETDAEALESTVEFTADSFRKQLVNLKRGAGIGGGAMTVSFGLWTFWEGQPRPSDEVLEAMAGFLLKDQKADGHWPANRTRPPLESSEVTSTVLATLGLRHYAPKDLKPQAEESIRRALEWLGQAPLETQEDRVSRLWGFWYLDPEALEAARAPVLATQRDDGGWAQQDGMTSDAYATGQTLAILRLTGTPADDPAFLRGIRYLLDTQQPDGSWFVQTRSRAFQTFFENGDPHGRSQFISTPATCWAVAALAGAIQPED